MAASEDEAKLIVFHGLNLFRLARCEELMCLPVPLVAFALSSQQIDGPVSGGGDDPTRRAGRDPGLGPAANCFDKRLLDRLFGEVDVAETTDQGGDGPTGLLPEDPLDEVAIGEDLGQDSGSS